jgi:hypothetical protein
MTEATAVAPKKTKATKTKTKTKTTKVKTPVETTTKTVEKGTRTLYYAYSVGCGWCKKTEPLIDELNKDGYNIQKLDVSVPENQTVINEVKAKYSQQCGTPYLVDADTGNMICGFREKDIIEKWANGEDIPAPPRPTGPPPRPPFMGATEEEETTWRTEYSKWLEKNEHLPENQKKTADEILAMPRPKSQPPAPPAPTATDAELDAWGDKYDVWKEENGHLPNLQPVDLIKQRFKSQRDGAGGAPGAPQVAGGTPNVTGATYNKDLNTEFYYVVEGGKRVKVMADEGYLRVLEHQYYVHEHDTNQLTKVVGDSGFNG